MTDRIHALAFNALGSALREEGVFVPLSGRDRIAGEVRGVVEAEVRSQLDFENEELKGLLRQAAHILAGFFGLGVDPDYDEARLLLTDVQSRLGIEDLEDL